MSTTLVRRIVKQRGFAAASLTSVAVLAALVVQQVLFAAISTLGVVAAGADTGITAATLPSILIQSLVFVLPFAIGVFVSLWFIAPIAAELRLFHVVTRSILAAGIGGALTLIVAAVLGLIGAVSFSGAIFANSFPHASFSSDQAFFSLINGVSEGMQVFVTHLPLMILAGILLWIWLDRHPVEHHVSGMIDQV